MHSNPRTDKRRATIKRLHRYLNDRRELARDLAALDEHTMPVIAASYRARIARLTQLIADLDAAISAIDQEQGKE